MPRLSETILDCVFFLYPSVKDAEAGEKYGGTGFFVGVQSETDEHWYHVYAITNSHVIREGRSPVIRLNTVDGKSDIVEFGGQDWRDHPDGDDVAALQWEPAPEHKFNFLSSKMFLTKERVSEHKIGIGDETYMVGRFINHEGKQRNTPATRFGNIAMMPLEPILHPRGILQESFVVESRSLPGYSGSPVFVYSTPFSPRPNEPLTNITFEFLLGIDWGHNRTHEEVRDKNDEPIPEGWRVRSNSGMMNVVPAWRFNDLLNLKEFEMYRKEQDKELKKKKKSSTSDLDAETGSKPFTKEDFEQALKKASKPKSDEEKKQ